MLPGQPLLRGDLTMLVQSFKYVGWSMLACASAVACTKTAPPETAYVSADLEAVSSLCPPAGATVLDVGSQSASTFPSTFTEGEQGLSLSCRVSANGDGFDIQLDAKEPGASGGELTVSGHINANGGKVSAQFVSQMAGASYSSSDCTVTYKYMGQDIPANERASGGSFFGHISCPMMMDTGSSISGTQVTGPDGGVENTVCDGEADVLFQNCDQ
jgi:hypothetical protein